MHASGSGAARRAAQFTPTHPDPPRHLPCTCLQAQAKFTALMSEAEALVGASQSRIAEIKVRARVRPGCPWRVTTAPPAAASPLLLLLLPRRLPCLPTRCCLTAAAAPSASPHLLPPHGCCRASWPPSRRRRSASTPPPLTRSWRQTLSWQRWAGLVHYLSQHHRRVWCRWPQCAPPSGRGRRCCCCCCCCCCWAAGPSVVRVCVCLAGMPAGELYKALHGAAWPCRAPQPNPRLTSVLLAPFFVRSCRRLTRSCRRTTSWWCEAALPTAPCQATSRRPPPGGCC